VGVARHHAAGPLDFALPAALLSLGAQLSRRPGMACGSRRRPHGAEVAVQPALALVALRALGVPPLETAVGVLLMAAPPRWRPIPWRPSWGRHRPGRRLRGGDDDRGGARLSHLAMLLV